MFLEQQILIKSNFAITGTNYILKLKGVLLCPFTKSFWNYKFILQRFCFWVYYYMFSCLIVKKSIICHIFYIITAFLSQTATLHNN